MGERKKIMQTWLKNNVKNSFFLLLLITLHLSLITAVSAALPIDEVLKAFVKETYPWAEVDITDVALSSEPSAGQPERILVQKGLPNKTVFLLEYKDGKRITATAQVKAFDWAVMTRRALRKGYVLQKEDVYTILMEIGRIPKDAVRVSDQLVGATLSRPVIANAPLVAGMVQESQQVKRGQRVMIVAESDSFSIMAKGELKETGYVGTDVKVLNLDSKKIVVGRLVSENTVKVVF